MEYLIKTLPEKEQAKARKANRLINEKSPYLLQHAYNPVDWYPWGKEAYQKAQSARLYSCPWAIRSRVHGRLVIDDMSVINSNFKNE